MVISSLLHFFYYRLMVNVKGEIYIHSPFYYELPPLQIDIRSERAVSMPAAAQRLDL